MSNSLFLHSLHKEKKPKKRIQQNNILSDSEHNDTIECICGDIDDDGFTIQCENCYTWQHGKCVHIKADKLPKHYFCSRCLKNNQLNTEAQHSLKKDTLRNNHEHHLFLHSSKVLNKNEQKGLKRSYGNRSRGIFSNISSSATTPIHQNNNNSNQQMTSTFTNKHIINHSKKLTNQYGNNKSIQKSKPHSFYDNFHNHVIEKTSHDDTSEVKVHSYTNDDDDDDDDYDKLVKPFDYSINSSSSTSSSSSSYSSSSSSSSSLTTTTTADSMKHKHNTRASFSTKFEQINRNVIKHKIVKNIMQYAYDQWKSSNNNDNDSSIVPLEATLLIPSIPKASARPLWKSLTTTDDKEDTSIRKGLFADIHIPKERFILEINGEIVVKSNYNSKPSSSYYTLHTPEDKTFFYPGLDLMMDSRNCGNDSRVVRRSCYPNAVINPIILPHNTKDATIHIGLFSTEYITKSEEICISWQWKRNSFMWELYNDWKNRTKNSLDDKNILQQIDHVLILLKQQFGECACEDKSECFIDYLKKNYQRRIKSPTSSSSSSYTSIRHKSLTDNKQRQQSSSRRRSSNSDVIVRNKIKSHQQQQQRRRSYDLIHTSSISTTTKEEQDFSYNNSKRHKSHSVQKPAIDSTKVNNEAKSDLFFSSLSSSKADASISTFKLSSTLCMTPEIIKKPEEPIVLVAPENKKNEAEEMESFNLSTITKTEDTVMDDGMKNMVKKWTPDAKLPCKKAWIRSYLATVATKNSNPSVLPKKTHKDEFINSK